MCNKCADYFSMHLVFCTRVKSSNITGVKWIRNYENNENTVVVLKHLLLLEYKIKIPFTGWFFGSLWMGHHWLPFVFEYSFQSVCI